VATPELPRIAKRLSRRTLTVRRAGLAIGLGTLVITVGAGLAMWLLDHEEFPNLGLALWWAVQTVTTVGYGDVTPKSDRGRTIATFVMLSGIGLVTVVTASITALFVEAARRRLRIESDRARDARFDQIEQTLARIEAALRERGPT
jgi:voltage-gated potassium channel